MTSDATSGRGALQSILTCLEDEARRRTGGAQPGAVLLDAEELAALLNLLRREVGAVEAQEARGR